MTEKVDVQLTSDQITAVIKLFDVNGVSTFKEAFAQFHDTPAANAAIGALRVLRGKSSRSRRITDMSDISRENRDALKVKELEQSNQNLKAKIDDLSHDCNTYRTALEQALILVEADGKERARRILKDALGQYDETNYV